MTAPALSATEEDPASASTTSEVCDSSGQLCQQLYEWTGDEAVAETASWLLATPLKLALILFMAFTSSCRMRSADTP